MQQKLKSWLLKDYDTSLSSTFEKARINLTADFAIYYIIFGFCSVLMATITHDNVMSIVTFVFLVINLFAIVSIKWTRNYLISAKVLSLSMVTAIMIIITISNAKIDIMHITQWLIALLFSHFTLGKKWTYSFTIVIIVYILLITSMLNHGFEQFIQPYYNPYFNLKISNAASPYVTIINLIIILLLLNFHQKNLKEAVLLATHSTKLKEGIMSVVAHDLRSPIVNILAINEFLKTNVNTPTEDDGESGAYTIMIDDMCKRSLNIINDLVDIAQIESSNFTAFFEDIELNQFIEDTIVAQQVNASQKNIKINYTPYNQLFYVNIDTHKFARVLDNIISNAIKFSNKNSEININIDYSKTSCIIQFEDFGIGIPRHLQAHIFEKFTIAGRRGTANEKTLGLGMSITKKIVELHQGKIWFESEINRGTKFFIQIPVIQK